MCTEGIGSGAVGKAFVYDARGLQFKSSQWQKLRASKEQKKRKRGHLQAPCRDNWQGYICFKKRACFVVPVLRQLSIRPLYNFTIRFFLHPALSSFCRVGRYR